jgi:hypothetical protein
MIESVFLQTMKTLDLNNYGVQEMNALEIKTTNGGFWPELALLIIGGIIADWDDFKKGVSESFHTFI